jgi:transcriptional regulator with XRE-family HTH domain
MTFGEYVAKKRQAKLLTQKELASLVIKENGQPISSQYVAEIEAGRRNPPSDHFIEQLASIFEISPEILYIKARRFPPGFDTDDAEFAASVFKTLGSSKAA